MEPIRIKKLHPLATVPTYGSPEAAGADLYACLEAPVTVGAGETVFVPTGLAMEVPKGCAGLIYARSSLGTKRGLAPANKVGVIDSDYRGQVMVALHNHGKAEQVIAGGERIAQLLITPVYTPGFVEAEELDDTQRGTGGFGSTGK
ncbi:MAG: dUTP diphosphatase [Oscillospiraceae bacterium]|nr:dUTP diphosphatase [Oscillospiraceae bacterium]